MHHLIKKLFFGFILTTLLASPAMAKRAGVITMVKGPVEVFIRPTDVPDTSKPTVKFENKFYTIKKAKIGTKLKFDQVIKTGPSSKLKINFINGDSMMIGPGTAYSLKSLKGTIKGRKKKSQMIHLIYGKIRAVVSKTGPRNNMRVKTKAAVAGVRGTDFYISYNPSEGVTRVDVLRGKVTVKGSHTQKTQSVQKGFSLQISIDKKTKKSIAKLKPITKEKLIEIQKETIVKVDVQAMQKQTDEIKKLVEELEIKAKKVILDDIKADDPEKYKTVISKFNKLTADEINQAVIKDLEEKAPTEPEMAKISEGDLQNSLENQSDAYKKYFK